jgi:hypothetical protein
MDAGATFVEKGATRDDSARSARLLAGFAFRDKTIFIPAFSATLPGRLPAGVIFDW